jgi:IS4 transposase
MDDDSRKLLDDLDEGVSIIEVDWRRYMDDVRTSVGVYGGLELAETEGDLIGWHLIVRDKWIRTEDIVSIRKLNQVEA